MSKYLLRGLLMALAVALLLAGAAVASLFTTFGQNAVGGLVESWATSRLGRAVRIDGEVRLQPGRNILFSANEVHVANAAWGSRVDMLVAKRVSIELDARSLLWGAPTLIVNTIRIEGLDLSLERTAEGENNWHFAGTPGEDDPQESAALPLVVDRVSLPGTRIRFNGPRLDRPLDLLFDSFEQQRGADDMLQLSASGRVNDTDLSIVGQIGPFSNLIAAQKFTAALDARLGELSLGVKAQIESLESPIHNVVELELAGPDAAYVATTLGVRNLGSGPFKFALAVSPAEDGSGVRGSIAGQIGEFDISGEGELSEPDNVGKLTFRTEVTGPDVSLLAGLFGIDRLPPERFRLAATVHKNGDQVRIDQAELELPDSAFTLNGSIESVEQRSGQNLAFRFSGAAVEKFREVLRIPGIATGPFDLSGTLQSSDMGDRFALKTATALVDIEATGTLGTHPEYFGTRLNASVSGPDFAPFARQIGLRVPSRSTFAGSGNFEWTPSGAALKDVRLKVGDHTLNLDGLVGESPAFNAAVHFGLAGKNLAAAAASIGGKGFPAQPYKLSGDLKRRDGHTRLNDVDITAAGARLQFSGEPGNAAGLDGAFTFVLEGRDLAPFHGLAPDVELPAGPFRAKGGIVFNKDRLRLRSVVATVADSEGEVTANVGLPLGVSVGSIPNEFDVSASGPDLKRLIPDVPDSPFAHQPFDVRAKGTWDREKWSFDTLRVDSSSVHLSVQGRFDRAPDYSATAIDVRARTADLDATGDLFGIDLPAWPLDFTATISGTPHSFRMENLAGRFGESDFAGSVALDLTTKPDLDIRLKSTFLDLTPLTGNAGDGTVSSQETARTRAVPDIELPTELLGRWNAEVSVDSAKTRFFGQNYDDLKLRGTLKDGHLKLDPLAFGSADGNLTAHLSISPDPGTPNVHLSARGEDIRLAAFRGVNVTAAASRYQVQIDVAATGLNLRDLVATLDGEIRLVGKGGRVRNSRFDAALSSDFLSELGRTLNPLSKREDFTDVVCQAYLFDARNGTLRTDPVIAIRTNAVDVVSTGSVDLRTEAIDFNFKTSARSGIGFSAGELLNPYVKVSGTLAKPYLTVDKKGTLVTGGAAFATGGLSIVASTLWDRVSRQKDPCAAAVAGGGRSASKKRGK